jgi:cell division protein FtsQ
LAKQISRSVGKPQAQVAFGFWDRPALMNLVADLLIVLAVATLVWAATTAIQRLPIFPLRQVVVISEPEQVTRAQLEQAARAAIAGNFFTVDLDAVRSAFEKLPWVRHADVRRRWPDVVELTLEEQAAVARWRQSDSAGGQESRLVNKYGEVFAAASTSALPIFAGPEGSASLLLARYQDFEQTLAPLGRHPESLVLSRREAWQVKLDDGLVLELGRNEAKHPLVERLARFVAYYRAAVDKSRVAAVGVVDMRYPNGFAIRVARKS